MSQPKIEVVVKMDSGATVVTGAGTNVAPSSFTAYNNKTISLQYEFKNFGTLKADRFNLDAGNLPRGAVLRATTCPIGDIVPDLAAGNKLLVTFKTSANGLDVKNNIVSDYNITTDWLTDLTIEPLGKFTTEDSTYILTAAHCLDDYKTEITATDDNFKSWDGKIIASGKGTLYVPPERINRPSGLGGASTDIAIMKLPKIAVPTNQNGAIVEQPILYDGSDEKGSIVEFVGYGRWGVDMTDYQYYWPSSGLRRLWGASKIDRIFELDHGIGASYQPKVNTEYWARVSYGDSGSAWWQDHQGRKVIIATTNGFGGSFSTGARVSKYIQWIRKVYPQARILSEAVNEPLVLKPSDHIPNAAINGNDVVVQKAASLNPL